MPIGAAESSFFLILNSGHVEALDWTHTGWAAKWAMRVPLRQGTFRWQTLYAAGDDGVDPHRSGEFRTIAQAAGDNLGAQGYWSLLAVSSPRGPADLTDLGLGLQNGGRGLLTIQAGWEHPIAERWSLYTATGWLRTDQPRTRRGARAIGTELLTELHWQMAEVLALDAGIAWLLTGDFLRMPLSHSAPENLHQAYARWQLEF